MRKALKIIGFLYILFLVAIFSFWSVIHIYAGGEKINPKISNLILKLGMLPSYLSHINSINSEKRVIENSTAINGITFYKDTATLSAGYFLISSFLSPDTLQIELLEYKKRQSIKKWKIASNIVLKFSKNQELDRHNLRLLHPLMLKDSSVIFITTSLFRIDKFSKVIWVNNNFFHHSIELADDSSIWVCGRLENKPFNFNGTDSILNDAITQVNYNTGSISYEKSISEILIENGYQYLLSIGPFEKDLIHVNEINPALYEGSSFWKKGDLLISIRHRNTVFIFRPDTGKIIWLKTGPWSNQHDCTFISPSQIMVLGNDIIRTNKGLSLLNKNNNIYIYDFKTNRIDTPYSSIIKKLNLKSLAEGRCEKMKNGDIFFESNEGIVYIFDEKSLKLTYSDRVDSKHLKLLNWTRIY